MAQDIRDLFKADSIHQNDERLAEGHEARFLKKLNETFPSEPVKSKFNWWSVAASIVIVFGVCVGGYTFYNSNQVEVENTPTVTSTEDTPKSKIKTLGDLSPDLKKVEDYYLASIHTELSKVELTPNNKELIDGYIQRLEELSEEYKKLSIELTETGPSELTINALIDNLRLRLNLLYRLRDQLKELKSESAVYTSAQKSF
ncbi:hypothetical protein FNB79_08990 [Formosa sediminum]|uniref:Anti-sigma factor n=1 Tax=Formosa sediminum TaxID=2594004 RepID=A0A516GRF9_9FLAO|nr:hypothetical protein [Formosa sediminum]QDO94108.1 hypothetical protein FNB79_08990 [Formosa sediminum]